MEGDVSVLAFNERWAFVQEQSTYCIVWIKEGSPSEPLEKKLSGLLKVNSIPGVSLSLKTEPGFGFVLDFKNGWSISTQDEAQYYLDQLDWELNRLAE